MRECWLRLYWKQCGMHSTSLPRCTSSMVKVSPPCLVFVTNSLPYTHVCIKWLQVLQRCHTPAQDHPWSSKSSVASSIDVFEGQGQVLQIALQAVMPLCIL